MRLRNTSILCEALNEQACVVFGVEADPIWRHRSECQAEEVEFVSSLEVCGWWSSVEGEEFSLGEGVRMKGMLLESECLDSLDGQATVSVDQR